MPREQKSTFKHPELYGAVGYNVESEITWTCRETSDVPKGKMLSPKGKMHLKPRVKGKAPNPISYPCLNPREQLLGEAVCEQKISGNFSEDHQKPCDESTANEDEELIKNMSKIPAYLQQLDKRKNIQGQALNFGVLDWKRLEKWKYNERMPGGCQSKVLSSSTTSLPMANKWPAHPTKSQRKQSLSCRLHVTYSHSESFLGGSEQLQGKAMKVQDSQDCSCGKTGAEPKLVQGGCVSSEGSNSRFGIPKSKWKELDEKPISEKKALSIDKGKKITPHTSQARDGINDARAEEEDDIGLSHYPSEGIELLLPKHFSKLNCKKSSQSSESRTSFDRQLKAMDERISSDSFLAQDLHLEEFDSEVPRSCPLLTTDALRPISSVQCQSAVDTAYMESDKLSASCTNKMPMNLGTTEAGSSSEKPQNEDHPISVDPLKKLDLEFVNPVVSGGHPSPNRRFSFSLGKISRSFSFKDNSAVPQLISTYSSIKSGPISSEASVGTDHCNREKVSTIARGKASPLRRLLEPLMKPRNSHSAESVRPSSASRYSASLKPMNTTELLQVHNQKISIFQALLQVTIKKGFPFFKLVIDNRSDILVAAVKNTLNGDMCLTFAFYSVHEIRKKNSGWLSHGSKSKPSSFGYNTVGQMTISNSYNPDRNAKDSKSVRLLTESVLYDVDPKKENIKAAAFIRSREFAAIIIENTAEKVDEGQQSKEDELVNSMCCSVNEDSCSTTVILPDGVHGMPDQGGPSSLIDRWRSGGSCDCGGWDVGCKLRILTNHKLSSKILMSPKCHTESINLFSQDGKRDSRPIMSLAPIRKGLYTVEFDTSISLLQAFSICVAVITPNKFPNILGLKIPSEAMVFSEDDTKTPPLYQGQVTPKYFTIPPPSPVERI